MMHDQRKETSDMNGTLEHAGDRWKLRFERALEHAPEKVWRAITEQEHLAAWFPHRIVGEWAVGAPLRFEHERFPPMDGEVLAYDAPSLLEFSWGPDTIRLEIVPRQSGCTLILTDTLEELGKAARDGAGWHTCLDMLERDLAGLAPQSDSSERWSEVHPGYVEKFGQAASTIGPPDLTTAGGGSSED
jgi:uncharacterized protein YndB with AHSA1/START domain